MTDWLLFLYLYVVSTIVISLLISAMEIVLNIPPKFHWGVVFWPVILPISVLLIPHTRRKIKKQLEQMQESKNEG